MISFINIYWVLGIVALTWHYVLFCGFISDDHSVIEERKDIIPDAEKRPSDEPTLVKIFNDGLVMFYWNKVMRKFFGSNSFFWHLLSYLLHILNVFLVYKVFLFMGDQTACCIALLWGVHPYNNQIAGWCSGRPYAIAGMFALLAMVLWQYPIAVMPLYGLSILTNFSVGLLPVMLKGLHPNDWQGNFYLFMLLSGVPFVAWKFKQRFSEKALVMDRKNFHFRVRRFNNMVRVIVYYVAQFIFPTRMGWYHQEGFAYNEKWDGFNVWALIGYVMVFFLCLIAPGLIFVLGMIPHINILVTNSYIQDRYLYFGGIGLSALLTPFLLSHPVFYVIVVSVFISKSYAYSRRMMNDETLYSENIRNHPKSDFAMNNLGFFLIQSRRYEEARCVLQRGLEINKDNKLIWYNVGITWAATASLGYEEGIQRFFRAMECWKRALQLEPRWKKPLDDIQKVVKVLVDNKILTLDKNQAMPDMPAIHTPLLNKEELNGRPSDSEVRTPIGS